MSLAGLMARLAAADLCRRTGRVTRILPTAVEADGPSATLGELCAIGAGADSAVEGLAEVVAVHPDRIVLAPFDGAARITPGAAVVARPDLGGVAVDDALLGRAVDALGRALDGGPPVQGARMADLHAPPPSALERGAAPRRLETGVRAIDCLLTLAEGQRIGVFAAAGVGKTTLLSQLGAQVQADRCVICLVGERGREAEALWRGLAPEVRARTTLVVATADQAAAMRARAVASAVTLADHWRQEGRHVLLLVDSVTRLAMALREIGLAAGEPPTVRAYTPGVFAAIPRLVERCGALSGGGATTAIFTVLSETDEVDDPVAEMMKSILDGHVVLSRSLAEQGHFPAIDAPRSISRMARALQDPEERRLAQAAIGALSAYESARTLIESGLYAAGADPEIDQAIARRPRLLEFLRQSPDAPSSSVAAWRQLAESLGRVAA